VVVRPITERDRKEAEKFAKVKKESLDAIAKKEDELTASVAKRLAEEKYSD
jgi:hypothetical protein